MSRNVFILVAAVALAACSHGPRLHRLSFPAQPTGAVATVETTSRSYSGELISVSDSGFAVLTNTTNRLTFVPLAVVSRVRVEGMGRRTRPFTALTLRQMRLVSRHPYGIPAEARAALLTHTGQTDFDRHGQ